MTTKKLMATLGALLTCTGVMATEYTWNPTVATEGDYLWETAANWIDTEGNTAVPGKADTAILPDGADIYLSKTADYTVAKIQVPGAATLHGQGKTLYVTLNNEDGTIDGAGTLSLDHVYIQTATYKTITINTNLNILPASETKPWSTYTRFYARGNKAKLVFNGDISGTGYLYLFSDNNGGHQNNFYGSLADFTGKLYCESSVNTSGKGWNQNIFRNNDALDLSGTTVELKTDVFFVPTGVSDAVAKVGALTANSTSQITTQVPATLEVGALNTSTTLSPEFVTSNTGAWTLNKVGSGTLTFGADTVFTNMTINVTSGAVVLPFKMSEQSLVIVDDYAAEVETDTTTTIYGEGAEISFSGDTSVVSAIVNGKVKVTGTSKKTYSIGTLTGSGELYVSGGNTLSVTGSMADFSGVYGVEEGDAGSIKWNAALLNAPKATIQVSDETTIGTSGSDTTYSGYDIKWGAFIGAATIKGGSQTYTLGSNDTNFTFSATLSRSVANSSVMPIYKVGTGTMTWSGTGSDSHGARAAFYINGGKVIIASQTSFDSMSSYVFGGGAIDVADGSIDVSSKISGANAAIVFDSDYATEIVWNTALSTANKYGLTKKGTSTLVLAKEPKYTGTTTVEEGALKVPTGTVLTLDNTTVKTASDETYDTYEHVEKIAVNGTKYADISKAVSNLSTGDTITLLGDTTIDEVNAVLPVNRRLDASATEEGTYTAVELTQLAAPSSIRVRGFGNIYVEASQSSIKGTPTPTVKYTIDDGEVQTAEKGKNINIAIDETKSVKITAWATAEGDYYDSDKVSYTTVAHTVPTGLAVRKAFDFAALTHVTKTSGTIYGEVETFEAAVLKEGDKVVPCQFVPITFMGESVDTDFVFRNINKDYNRWVASIDAGMYADNIAALIAVKNCKKGDLLYINASSVKIPPVTARYYCDASAMAEGSSNLSAADGYTNKDEEFWYTVQNDGPVFFMIEGKQRIYAIRTYAKPVYTVSFTRSNCTLKLNGSETAFTDADYTMEEGKLAFTVTADEDYEIESVMVGTTDLGKDGSYEIDVSANMTVTINTKKTSKDPVEEVIEADVDTTGATTEEIAAAKEVINTIGATEASDYFTAVYGNQKVPAATIAAANNVATSVKYELPLMSAEEPTIEVEASTTADSFDFEIKDGDTAVNLPQVEAKVLKMVEFTSDLDVNFADATSTDLGVSVSGTKATVTFKKATDAGFMRVNLK